MGITEGGDDGHGHFGFATAPGLVPFGKDVFNAPLHQRHDQGMTMTAMID